MWARWRSSGYVFVTGLLLGTLVGMALGWQVTRPEPLTLDIPTLPPPPTPAPITVYVSGAVARPGVYTLPPDSRAVDAIKAAGGLTAAADPAAVNLAQRLTDEAHLHVPTRPPTGERATPRERTPTPTVPLPIDINTAPAEVLMTLPGVGPTMAERIIANRPYSSVEDLLRVRGIGPATLEKLRPYITVNP